MFRKKKCKRMRFRLKLIIIGLFVYLLMIFYCFNSNLMNFDELKNSLNSLNVLKRATSETRRAHQSTVIVYNRVPKTASTSFVGLAYDFCTRNRFHVIHINVSSNMHLLALNNQYELVQNISNWDRIKPAFFHGHLAFLDFSKFGFAKPLFINIVRKPLDRFVSYYYFLQYGDNFRPGLIRKKHGSKMTFDECIQKSHPDCDLNKMWLQIPFFCGYSSDCWKPGNEWALTEAKKNLVNEYFVVGLTENLTDFVRVLEITIPRFFRNTLDSFRTSNKSHLRKTKQKFEPLLRTVRKIAKNRIWRLENEFYEFASEQFALIKQRIFGQKKQTYFYEKIRPK